MMIRFANKFLLIFSLLTVAWSCQAGKIDFDAMASAEKKFHKRQRQELIIFMPLETMFPNEDVQALAKAAGKGKVKTIEKLVKEGVSVDSRGKGDATPLFWALRNGNKKGFEKLLELGADPNALMQGGGVIHWAAWHKNIQFLKLSLLHGGDPNLKAEESEKTPLFETITVDYGKEAMLLLLDAGADVNTRTAVIKRLGMVTGKQTPALLAADLLKFDIVSILLEHGADPTVKDYQGYSLADSISEVRNRIKPGSNLERDMNKVVKWLSDNAGIEVPIY